MRKLLIPVYIDDIKEYNDYFYEYESIRFCPNRDNMLFYNDDLIKHRLIENIFDYFDINAELDFIHIPITLTEEEIFYLSLKYDSFLNFLNKLKDKT